MYELIGPPRIPNCHRDGLLALSWTVRKDGTTVLRWWPDGRGGDHPSCVDALLYRRDCSAVLKGGLA